MNRYTLTNQKTGGQFSFEAADFPKEMQPEWGESPRVEIEDITVEMQQRKQAEDNLAISKDRLLKMSTSGMSVDDKAKHEMLVALVKQYATKPIARSEDGAQPVSAEAAPPDPSLFESAVALAIAVIAAAAWFYYGGAM